MAATRTFSIIKPDATRRNLTGAVTKMLEDAGLRVVASKRIRMTEDQAKKFYEVHAERPFYGELVDFMTSGRRRRRHDPQGLRRIDRSELGPRFGQRRKRRDRNRVLLQRR